MLEWITMTTEEIDALDRKLPLIIPVGLVEAHGPHMPVSVDVDSAVYFARECAGSTGAVLMPTLPYGFSDEMREYPGSLGLSWETFTRVISDLCLALCAQGFKKLIFLTGHGANKNPCELAFYRVWESYPDFRGVCWNWWSDCGISGVHHADKGETEVAMAIGVPVYQDRMRDADLKKPWYKIRSRHALDPGSGGVNGKPTEADPAHGILLRDQALKALHEKITEAFKD
jgi:creatinine amidohydrolase